MARPLGRLVPPNFDHVVNHRFAVEETVSSVESVLRLPRWHWKHDQGNEGSCVGHCSAMERAITNNLQVSAWGRLWRRERWYDPIWIWNQAKLIDGDPNSNPGDDNGTYVHSGYDVLRDKGIIRCSRMELREDIPTPIGDGPILYGEGVSSNAWATTVDEVRTAISEKRPCAIGVNWYTNFDKPQSVSAPVGWWPTHTIGQGDLERIRGGHALCVYGASDQRQAFALKNSWGADYPLVWMGYETFGRLLSEDGECALVTDR